MDPMGIVYIEYVYINSLFSGINWLTSKITEKQAQDAMFATSLVK